MGDPFQDESLPASSPGHGSGVTNVEISDGTPSSPGGAGCCGRTRGFFLYESSRRDVQAFYLNQFGRSVLYISFMFLSLAILQLANEQAGCPKNPETGAFENCDNKVYGVTPSSMLSLMATVGGITTAVFMPYAGAVVDFSENRLRFGRAMALIFVLINVVQIFLFPSTWFVITMLQAVIASASFMGNAMFMWSYLTAPNDEDLHGITGSGRLWESMGMLIFFIVVGAVQFVAPWDAVGVAMFSQALASVVGGTCLFLAFRRYEPAAASKKLRENENLYAAGVRSLWRTIKDLHGTEPTVHRYLCGYMFIAVGMSSLNNLAVTYLSEQVQMSSIQVVIFVLGNLIVNPIGVLIHKFFANRIGHKKNYLLVNSFLLAATGAFAGVVAGPDQKNIAYIFSVLMGIGYGWYYPSSNGFFVSIVPDDRKMELWGWNMFGAAVLSWAPPFFFTILNEATGSLQLAMLSIIIFQAIGLSIASTIPVKKENPTRVFFDSVKGSAADVAA